MALLSKASLLGAFAGAAFPIEEFKSFFNEKPTIEQFLFAADPRRFSSEPEGTIRRFEFISDGPSVFKLFEDTRFQANSNPNGCFWVRFDNQYWHRFNSKDVFTTLWNESDSFDHSYGPARGVNAHLGLAYDALNFGILGLGTNGLQWSGFDFTAKSAETGGDIAGSLTLDANGRPRSLKTVYTVPGNSSAYEYTVSYHFKPNNLIPRFFPSEIRVRAAIEPQQTVALYLIERLTLSNRRLTLADVDHRRHLTTDSKVFMQSNGVPYAFARIAGSNVPIAFGTMRTDLTDRPPHGLFARQRIAIIALLGLPSILVLMAAFRRRSKHQRAKKTP